MYSIYERFGAGARDSKTLCNFGDSGLCNFQGKPTTQGWVFPIAKIYIPLHYVCRLVFYKQPCLYVETFMNRDCNPV